MSAASVGGGPGALCAAGGTTRGKPCGPVDMKVDLANILRVMLKLLLVLR